MLSDDSNSDSSITTDFPSNGSASSDSDTSSESSSETCLNSKASTESLKSKVSAESLPTEIEMWTKEDVLFNGLSWVGFTPSMQQKVGTKRNLTRFREHYGTTPATYTPLIHDILQENGSLNLKKFMMSLNWAKNRNRRSVMTANWHVCEEKVYPFVFEHLELIQRMKPTKIRFEFSSTDNMIKGSLDCTTFTGNEFRDDPSAENYDPKSASCGIVSKY